jgi:hypothetical protein
MIADIASPFPAEHSDLHIMRGLNGFKTIFRLRCQQHDAKQNLTQRLRQL